MSLKRGFKAEANRISLRLRQSLGLAPSAPIDLAAVAGKLDFKVHIVTLSSFEDEFPDAVRQLFGDQDAFSAGTVPLPKGARVIIYNDSHSEGRQRNSIAHELAHLILGHEFTLPIDNSGCRILDRDVEDEASWLSSVILIPDAAALEILRTGLDTETTCKRYGVSKPLLRMRLNSSGARIRLARSYN